ncbi:MAG: TetR/AcrR family transcriptional regulator [Leptospirales bacterium]|nr:TetR/AcrR family transcriptional regulator [Leptospirales bacterium]
MLRRILDRTLILFLSRGFHRVNTDEIAQSVGISKRTLYRYYSSKEKLISAVIDHFKAKMRGRIDEVLARTDLVAMERFQMVITHVAEMISRISPDLMLDLERERPDIFQDMMTFRASNIRSLAGVLREAQKQGAIDPRVDVDFAIDMLLASINGLLNPKYLMAHSISFDQGLAKIHAIFLQGIETRAKTGRTSK